MLDSSSLPLFVARYLGEHRARGAHREQGPHLGRQQLLFQGWLCRGYAARCREMVGCSRDSKARGGRREAQRLASRPPAFHFPPRTRSVMGVSLGNHIMGLLSRMIRVAVHACPVTPDTLPALRAAEW